MPGAEETTQAEFWEAKYAGVDRVWSGRVNAVLSEVASGLQPGRALDLGCGEGGDVVWLAGRGWHATGVDLSPTAIARARAAAEARGIGEDRLRLIAGDLLDVLEGFAGEETFDLVTASFLHSWPVSFPRDEILRRAAGLVAPGGTLLIVAHAAAPPWANAAHADHEFPTPESDLAAIAGEREAWDVVVADVRERVGAGPDGQAGVLLDSIVQATRR